MKIPNWFVITGVPSSGKTTILSKLSAHGFATVDEAARLYIDAEIERGKTIAEIRKNELAFQRKVLEMKLTIERKTAPNATVFFDRGIPDSLAYYVLCGVHYDKFLAQSIAQSTYKKVFLFEPLPYMKDYARTESESDLQNLHELLRLSYSRLQIPVISVAPMTVQERFDFVVSHVGSSYD